MLSLLIGFDVDCLLSPITESAEQTIQHLAIDYLLLRVVKLVKIDVAMTWAVQMIRCTLEVHVTIG